MRPRQKLKESYRNILDLGQRNDALIHAQRKQVYLPKIHTVIYAIVPAKNENLTTD